MDSKQAIALALIILLVINLVLFGMGKLSELVFWFVIAAVGVGTFFFKKRFKST